MKAFAPRALAFSSDIKYHRVVMLKRFTRWSWFAPIAKRLLRKYGKFVVLELLEKVKISEGLKNRLTELSDGLTPADAALLQEIASYVALIGTPKAKEVAKVLTRIITLIS
jgi:hypothetical protein